VLAKYFFSTAVFGVGAAALVLPSGYSLGFYLLCFAGLGLWLKHRGSLVPDDTHHFFLPLLAYALGQMILALHEKWAAREFSNYLPFVLVLFGVWGVRRYKPKTEWFWAGLAIGAIGASALSGYQAMVLGMRAGGHTHPIQFGNVALLFGVLCVVRALVGAQGWAMRIWMWVGFMAGLAASVWSQTRGGWLAVVLIFIWILVNATRACVPYKRVALVLGMWLVLAIPALQPNGVVQSRVAVAVSEFNAFFEHGKQDTSVGARLAMWSIAMDEIGRAPVLGHGNQGWIEVRDAALADGRLSSFSSRFTHLHNEYLNVAFKRGLVGLALYLALYLVPMWMFFKPYVQDGRADVRALAMAGMVIPMMFMDFGLTQTFLSHNSGRVVLCSLWMCVAGLMLNAIETSKSSCQAAPSC
jgi:O-antigen ligase